MAAFLSLGLAGFAAILLALYLNLDFPTQLDNVAKRLTSPALPHRAGTAIVSTNAARTNRTVLQTQEAHRDAAGQSSGQPRRPSV